MKTITHMTNKLKIIKIKTKHAGTVIPAISPPDGAVMKKTSILKPVPYTQSGYIRISSEIVTLCDIDEVLASVKEKYFTPFMNKYNKHSTC